jgi:hypothetical protein
MKKDFNILKIKKTIINNSFLLIYHDLISGGMLPRDF